MTVVQGAETRLVLGIASGQIGGNDEWMMIRQQKWYVREQQGQG